MNDNDVILWQARILAGQASMIDQMGHELDDAQKAAEGMVSASELDALRRGQDELAKMVREQDETIASRVQQLNELREVRNKQAQVIEELEQAVKNRDAIIDRHARERDRTPALVGINHPALRTQIDMGPSLVSGALAGVLNLATKHDLTRAQILAYLHVHALGVDRSSTTNIGKRGRLSPSIVREAMRKLRRLGLVK